ncbi:hypothetical protein GGI04_002461 [Coemansia thaxteri]|uniref:Uncharacterized protein n=1 Tax=Coemansia thaxteri TaxID=2663907 RepID=A0A9W8EG17_9FUNG|nr:hypothetical protein H4R26_006036 [Coemansia thaxteri]KAJ2004857.1 hypothetical protein GGI04_002461 [Coemansia thaxteri]KAJ2473615.1 hypothetical protein GGI02_000721 [Coemansia sp. RSA 2322]KAJ2487965.1 hypothetical protein EV174_000202 [Coemansia sp. RSA 2320]
MHASLLCCAALFALTHALPTAEAPENAVLVPGEHIQRLDASHNCLPPAARSLSGSGRVVLDSLARELKNSMFRDFHQFAPAALALGRPEIESKILGNDYSGTISGLRELKSFFISELPGLSNASAAPHAVGSASTCEAPTARNLRVIYSNLDKLLQQYV